MRGATEHLRQTLGVVIPFPRNRDAETRKIHRNGIASEKRNGRLILFGMILAICALSAGVAFGTGYLQGRFGSE